MDGHGINLRAVGLWAGVFARGRRLRYLVPMAGALRNILVMWLILGAWLSVATAGQTLPTAGTAGQYWVVQPGELPETIAIWHRAAGDPEGQLDEVDVLHGQLAALGAVDQSLWLIYAGGVVQTVDAQKSQIDGNWLYQVQRETSLPRGLALRAMDVGASGAWVVARVDSQQLLDELDGVAATQAAVSTRASETAAPAASTDDEEERAQARRRIAMGLPPVLRTPATLPAEEATPAGEVGEAGKADKSIAVDRLLHLQRGEWTSIALPADWQDGSPCWLAVSDEPGAPLWLVAVPASEDESLWVYEASVSPVQDEITWQKTVYRDITAHRAEVMSVQRQLVLASITRTARDVTAQLAVLRQGEVLPVGELAVEPPSIKAWGVTAAEGGVALTVRAKLEEAAAAPETLGLWIAQMNLQGQVIQPATELTPMSEPAFVKAADYVILVAVLVMAMLIIFLFWRRDAQWQHLALPKTLELAPLAKRALAGVVDMLPCMLAVMAWYGVDLELLLLRWPGQGHASTWEAVEPGVVAIGIFLLHVTVSELLTTRTLGKWITGLRVTTLDGRRPKLWQLLVRNVLKSFDLIAWLLLLLPIIGPYRQRLGDLVARTVVVAPKTEQPTDEAKK